MDPVEISERMQINNSDVETLTSLDLLDHTLDQDSENVVSKLFQRVKSSFTVTNNISNSTSNSPQPASGAETSDSTSSSPPLTPSSKSSRPPSILIPNKANKGFIHGGVTPAPPVISLTPAFSNSMMESEMGTKEADAFLGSEGENYGIPANGESLTNTAGSNPLQPYKDESDARSYRSSQAASIGNTNSLKKVIRRLRGEGVNKNYWMADDLCQECYDCKATFTAIRRKHHCRICGQIFCSKCTQYINPGERFQHDGPMRVCNFCMGLMKEYGDESESEIEQAIFQKYDPSSDSLPKQIPTASSIPGSNYSTTSVTENSSSLTPSIIVSQAPLPRTPSPDTMSINDGLKKVISAGSSLFMSRSRSNTVTEENPPTLSSSPAPFIRSLTEEDKTTPAVNPEAVLDPEIAPYMSDDGEHYDLCPTSNVLNFLPTNADCGESASPTPAVSEYAGSDDDSLDYNMKPSHSKLHQKGSRNDEIRNHFDRDGKGRDRRRSINGVKPQYWPKNRGLMRQINTSVTSLGEVIRNGSPIERTSSPFHARHHRSLSQPIKVEINPNFQLYMRRLLQQSLREAEVDLSEGWEDVIMKLMFKISENLSPDVRNGDEIDIRHYVKIKKIPGGTPQDSQYATGVVCTKKLTHKQMQRSLSNPRVLILTFPLEYQRVEKQFMSLEPVIAQEEEYLKNLVARIANLRPHLVLVEKTIARTALQFLLDAKLTVASNVKHSVIQAVARCTRADIIPSMDKLVDPKLGKCNEFYVKTYEHQLIPGRRKSYLFFEGCPKELGCTIVLRGSDVDTLEKVKQVTDLMAFVVYNLKLETALMANQCARPPSHPMEERLPSKTHTHNESKEKEFADAQTSEADKMIELLRPYEETILSATSYIKFPPPYLLVRMAQTERRLTELTLKKIESSTVLKESAANNANTITHTEQVIAEAELADVDAEHDQLVKSWDSYMLRINNPSPFAHQNIIVLYSNICNVTRAPCQGPEIHAIEYYSDTDRTLGQYLEEMCRESGYLCPAKTCDRPLLMHHKSYCHNQARINVVIEQFESKIDIDMENTIHMWSYCTKCTKATQMIPMSEETWRYSFGKYLEQSFYQMELRIRAESCPHSIYRDHKHYFGLGNLVVQFEYQPINLMEVSVPPTVLRTKPEVSIRLKDLDLEFHKKKISRYWDSVTECITNFNYDVVNPEKIDACKKDLHEMSQKAAVESKYCLQSLQQSYNSSAPTNALSLNSVIFTLQEKVRQWDQDFNDIARKYVQTRISTRQLKKMFDKDYPLSLTRFHSPSNEHNYFLGLDDIFSQNGHSNTISTENLDEPVTENDVSNATEKSNSRTTISESKEPPQSGFETDQVNSQRIQQTDSIDQKTVPAQRVKPSPRAMSDPTLTTVPKNKESQSVTEDPRESKETPSAAKRKQSSAKTSSEQRAKDDIHKKDHHTTQIQPSQITSPDLPVGRATRVLENEKAKEEKSQDRLSSKNKRSKKNDDASEKAITPSSSRKSIRSEAKSKLQDLRKSSARTFDKYGKKAINKLRRNKAALAPKPTIKVFNNVKEAVKEESDEEDQDEEENEEENNAKGVPIPNKTETHSEPPITNEQSDESYAFDTSISYQSDHDKPSTPLYSEDSSPTKDFPDPAELSQNTPFALVKSIANFWADRNAAILKPLDYPLLPTEHVFSDSNIIVREDEPSSIISFTLSSKDYLEKMQQTHAATVTEVFEDYGGNDGSNWDLVDMDEGPGNIKEALLRETSTHMKYEFTGGSTEMVCKVFFAEQFDALRRNCKCESSYIQSLARCVKWDSSGGKSGSAFLKTQDDRLIMKQLSRPEMDAFLQFAPAYFDYMSKALYHDLPTVLAKIFGFYRISYKNEQYGRSMKIDVIVMENLFYERKISRIFDLKGSMRNRHVRSTGKENEVLLDENLLELLNDEPLYFREHSKMILRASLYNDTLFLAKLNVMDYSLLVGIDEEKKELVVGIVDFIRTFTLDKKLESWVKETGFLGGGGKEPTIVSPRQYKYRFREAMDRYFFVVPDRWSTHRKNHHPAQSVVPEELN